MSMDAYFEAHGVTLYCGEALLTLANISIPIDAFITDLPYGTTACSWDTVIPFEPMWAQVKRLLKPRGVFVTTANQPFASALVMSNLTWFRYEWVWEKNRKTRFLDVNRRPLLAHENVLVFSDGQSEYNPQMTIGKNHVRGSNRCRNSDNYGAFSIKFYESNEWFPDDIIRIPVSNESCKTISQCPTRRNVHPTEKPVSLYEYLIRTYTNHGDLVCDFCAGSGTTGVACIRTGRNFIGIELEERYCEIAAKRLERELQQPRLIPVVDVASKVEQKNLW